MTSACATLPRRIIRRQMTRAEMVRLVKPDVLNYGFQAGFIKDALGRQGLKWSLSDCASNCAISPGCLQCPALMLALKGGCKRAQFLTCNLLQPLRWRTPRIVFVCPQGDLFHEDISDASIAQVFAVMDTCPDHLFLVLTKRAKRMGKLFSSSKFVQSILEEGRKIFGEGYYQDAEWGLNLLVGVSVEDQPRMERANVLLDLPGLMTGVVFVAPMLSALQFRSLVLPNVGWVVCNQERGGTYSKPRPCKREWKRDLQLQCWDADVPFFLQDRLSPELVAELGDGPLREYPRHPFYGAVA